MRALTFAVLLLLSALGAAGGARADNPVLTGVVGTNDAYRISLTGPTGGPVRSLDPGTYALLVHDNSQIHNFHLTGPGVDVATPIEQTGDFAFTVVLSAGTYTYVCDAHANVMKGSFTVGAVSTPAPPPKPMAAPTKLLATVGPGTRISLRATGGALMPSLSAGSFTIVVTDRSATDDFRLVGPGVSKATGAAFEGTVTWRLTLKAGRYTFRSDEHAVLHGAFALAPQCISMLPGCRRAGSRSARRSGTGCSRGSSPASPLAHSSSSRPRWPPPAAT